MNKQQYLAKMSVDLGRSLADPKFENYKNQIFAWRLSAVFNRTYDESYLWNRALYLSTTGCILLSENMDRNKSIKALKESAEVYEYLAEISEMYDRQYARLLSSLCYDIAGYQANAFCLAKGIMNYEFESTDDRVDITSDNYMVHQIALILSKAIPQALLGIRNDLNINMGLKLFNQCISEWYDNILNGNESNFLNDAQNAYMYFLNTSNLHISQVLFLLRIRMQIYLERSIWGNLNCNETIKNSPIWQKYIKLLTHDVYDENQIKDITARISRFELWVSQLRAVESGLLATNENFVIQMPTSAGKTFIAELCILNQLVENPGKKCIYIAPYRTLTNEKERELAQYLSKLGFSVSAISGSYEVDEFQQIVLEDTDVLVATPEKMDLLLRMNPSYFDDVTLLVVDEGHIVGDINTRSSLLEFLIIRLRIRIPQCRILFISAVMPPENADEYSIWLSDKRTNVLRSLLHKDSPVDEQWEPTRKLIGSFTWEGNSGRIDYINVMTEDADTHRKRGAFVPSIIKARQYDGIHPNKERKVETSASLGFELSKDGNCLIFCAKVADTKGVGESLLAILDAVKKDNTAVPDHFKFNPEKESSFYSSKWYGPDYYVTRCLEHGIGIHFGDMPEPVRRSVESEFNSGILRILISTSTVGQGLNFPIKHMVVHSTIMGYDQGPVYIKVRDFWNIIGRAGRAGHETEGQVIFVINSPTDRASFEKYTNKDNIEQAYSMFFNVLNALVQKRISHSEYEQAVQTLTESYMLNILMEEVIESNDEKTIEQIIDNSLFKVQLEAKNIEIQPLMNSFTGIMANIRNEVPEKDVVTAYGLTGFKLSSNQVIDNYIQDHRSHLETVVECDDYLGLLMFILQLLDNGEIDEAISYKLDRITSNPSEWFDVIRLWIEGQEITELQKEWNKLGEGQGTLNILISEGLYYRYSWTITSFITILIYRLDMKREDLPDKIRNLPSYLKFGLNDSTACLARSLGIKNRDIALLLSSKSDYLTGREFVRWVSNLTAEELHGYQINQYDTKNILDVALKLNPNRYTEMPTSFAFGVRGISYDQGRISTSFVVSPGDKLTYDRDKENEFDPFAIKIYHANQELGFVPREHSRFIATEIDLNHIEYEIFVTQVEIMRDYQNVIVIMQVKE